MKNLIFKFLKIYFLPLTLIILFCCKIDDRNSNHNTAPVNNKVNCCDTSKPVGKIISSGHIKELDSLPRVTNKNLNDIKRYGAGLFIAAGDSGTVLLTPNAGLDWDTLRTNTFVKLRGCAILDFDTLLAVGDSGKIIRSSDKGNTWSNLSTGNQDTLNSITFAGKNIGYICGNLGLVLKTINGGLTWNTILNDTSKGNITCIYFADTSRGWFCTRSGLICSTTNGGATWNTSYNNNALVLNSLSFNGLSRGTAVGNNGVIINTTNGGVNWSLNNYPGTPHFYGVHRINDSLSYICGNGIILREDYGTYNVLVNNPAYKFNAVDPHPYVYGIVAADLGLMCGVSVSVCDCINQNNLVMMPTEENHKWRISVRLNNDASYNKLLRIFTPGFEVDNNVITGWTQNDQAQTTTNELTAALFPSSTIPPGDPDPTGSYTVSGINDVITVNLEARTSALINISLGPNASNSSGAGSVSFYYGSSENNYCAHVKYNLQESQ